MTDRELSGEHHPRLKPGERSETESEGKDE